MSMNARDVMTMPAIVVAPDATIAEIAALLSSHHISAVPVVGPDGALVGLVSEGDILRTVRESVGLRRDHWLDLLAEGEDLPAIFLDYLRRDTRTAADVMAHPVITATEGTSLPQLAELMMGRKVKRIPIIRDRHVVGIVSRSDLVAALARAPAMVG